MAQHLHSGSFRANIYPDLPAGKEEEANYITQQTSFFAHSQLPQEKKKSLQFTHPGLTCLGLTHCFSLCQDAGRERRARSWPGWWHSPSLTYSHPTLTLLSPDSGRGCFVCLSCLRDLNDSFSFFPRDPPQEKCPTAIATAQGGRGWCHLVTAAPALCRQHGLSPGQPPSLPWVDFKALSSCPQGSFYQQRHPGLMLP